MKGLCVFILLSLVSLVAAGCASRGAESAGSPDDFALDVTVGPAGELDATAQLAALTQDPIAPAHLRAARYVLLPGGDFYTAADSTIAAVRNLPPFARTLSHQELEALWRVAQRSFHPDSAEAGRSDAHAESAQNFEAEELVCRLSMAAGGTTRRMRVATTDEGDVPLHVRDLVRSLAALAWVSDAPSPARVFAPRRYDFGPDPYARYRAPSTMSED